MGAKITKLTPAQLARIPEVRDQWLATGLSTERADRPRAEAGVRLAYEAAGLEPPKIIVWLDSPMAGAMGAALLSGTKVAGAQVRAQVGAQVWAQVRDQVRDQVGAQVWAQVGDQVWAQVRGQVGVQVGDQVWAQVGAQVWDQVWDQVWAQVGAQVRDPVRAQVRDWSSGCAWGQHDAWLSFYDTFDELGIVDGAERIRGLVGVARNCGWWWPLAGAVVLCERTNRILRDPQGRLHCADGPALSYPGDFHIWCWHGTPVPQDLIETPWDVTRIMAESNTEVRRCAIEKMGWDQFVVAADLTLADESDDPANPGQKLRLYDVPRKVLDLPVRVLVASNATVERNGERHTFGLTVPTDCTTAMSAAGWTFDLTEGEYAELARAT